MNHIRRIGMDGGLMGATLNTCHPERGLAASEASGRTQSKGPCDPDAIGRNFRVAVRFFDDHDIEVLHDSSRQAAEWESPARQCWVTTMQTTESRRDATLA